MSGVVKQQITIPVGDEQFVLRVPTPLERAQIGVREAAMRVRLDPAGGNFAMVDDGTFELIRGMVVLEVLLEHATVKWVWTETNNSKGEAALHVDVSKFPPGTEDAVMEVGRQFQEAVDRFHGKGIGRNGPAVPQAVDGGENPGAL